MSSAKQREASLAQKFGRAPSPCDDILASRSPKRGRELQQPAAPRVHPCHQLVQRQKIVVQRYARSVLEERWARPQMKDLRPCFVRSRLGQRGLQDEPDVQHLHTWRRLFLADVSKGRSALLARRAVWVGQPGQGFLDGLGLANQV